jgi:NAD(P)-dependent dehydrogenase (short-subunit alcohol dehydrogenase family)
MTEQPWRRSADAGRRLEGRVAVVTGAGSSGSFMGVGVATAVLFAAQGAKVGVVDVSAERAEATKALVEAAGGECEVAVGDLTDLAQSAECVGRVAERFGRLDTLVNSAAIVGGGGSPADVDLAEWDRVMAVNLTAALYTTRHAVPHLRAAGAGAIVNISSIAAIRGMGAGAYAASKAAMIGLTQDWAYTHGRDGIRVNCICPGHVFTPMGDQGGDELRRQRRRAGLLGTEGDAWDIAWAAVFLASDEARWITGMVLPVDAGTTTTTALAVGFLNQRDPEA